MADSSEWQCVRRGRGGAHKAGVSQGGKPEAHETVDRERDKRRITERINELRCEDFWSEWKEILSGCLAETVDKTVEGLDCFMECVCYGLGNFSSCASARYQLAMLLLLLDVLQIPVSRCSLYDPVFTVSECATLRELGFTVLTENEEGKRAVRHHTLFYLMHCGKALYNNLLWKNWSPQILPKVIIIGNSFLGIQERMLQRELERDYSFLSDSCKQLLSCAEQGTDHFDIDHIHQVVNVCEETNLPCSQRFLDVFNDTALIRFPQHKLLTLPESIWDEPSEPHYEHCQDLEIIQRVREPK